MSQRIPESPGSSTSAEPDASITEISLDPVELEADDPLSQLIAFEAAKAGQAFGFLQSLDDDPVIDDDVSTVSSVVVRYPFSGSAGVDPNVDAAVGVKAGPAVSAAVRRLPFAGVAERPSSLYSAGAVPGGFRTNFADKLGSAFNKLQRRVVAPPRTHDSPVSGSSSSGLGSLPFTASLDEPPSREGPEHRRAFSGMCRDSGQVRPSITDGSDVVSRSSGSIGGVSVAGASTDRRHSSAGRSLLADSPAVGALPVPLVDRLPLSGVAEPSSALTDRRAFSGVSVQRRHAGLSGPDARAPVAPFRVLGVDASEQVVPPGRRQPFAGRCLLTDPGRVVPPRLPAVDRLPFSGVAAGPVPVRDVSGASPDASEQVVPPGRRQPFAGRCLLTDLARVVPRRSPAVARLSFSGVAVVPVPALGVSGASPGVLVPPAVPRMAFSGIAPVRRFAFSGASRALAARSGIEPQSAAVVVLRLAFSGVALRRFEDVPDSSGPPAAPVPVDAVFRGFPFSGQSERPRRRVDVQRFGFAGVAVSVRSAVREPPRFAFSGIAVVAVLPRLPFCGRSTWVSPVGTRPASLPTAPPKRFGFEGAASSRVRLGRTVARYPFAGRIPLPPMRRFPFVGRVASRLGAFSGVAPVRSPVVSLPVVARYRFAGCAGGRVPVVEPVRLAFAGIAPVAPVRLRRLAFSGVASLPVRSRPVRFSPRVAADHAGAQRPGSATRRLPFAGVAVATPQVPPSDLLQPAPWAAQGQLNASRVPPAEEPVDVVKDVSVATDEQHPESGQTGASDQAPVNQKPTDPDPDDTDVVLQAALDIGLEGREAAELEAELLEHLEDSGVNVEAHRARLRAAFKQSKRQSSAIEFQMDFQQALSGWRTATRRTAAQLQVILDEQRLRSQAIMKQYLLLESGVTVFQGRLKEIDSTIDEHRTAIEEAAGKQTKRLNARVEAVSEKLNTLMTSLTGRLDNYSEDVKSRTNKLFQGSNEAADAVKLKFQELDESADKALTTMKSAEVRVHSIETRSAAVDRELKDAEQRFIALLARFQTPMAVAAFAGGVVGACVAALMAVIVWSLLGSTAGG